MTNAQYLTDIVGVTFENAVEWAKRFPNLSKEELLDYCINQTSFFRWNDSMKL